MKNVCVLIPLFLFLLSGCSRSEQEETETYNSRHRLIIIDSIGVDFGDSNYVFGQILPIGFTSTGNIFVGDAHKMKISLFTPEGKFIRSGGNSGEGPGEFVDLTCISPTYDGGIAVCDRSCGKIIFYDSTLSLDYEINGFHPLPPTQLAVLPDGAIAGTRFAFDREDGKIYNALERWEQGETEPSVTYMETAVDVNPSSLAITLTIATIYFNVLSDGSVIASPSSFDEYVLHCFKPDGELLWESEIPFEKTPRSEADIEIEREQYRNNFRRMGANPAQADHFELCEWAEPVIGIYIVGDTEIWIRRSGKVIPEFDVFSIDGEFLYSCTVPQLPHGRSVGINVSKHGVLATNINPEDYPRIYLLEKQQETW